MSQAIPATSTQSWRQLLARLRDDARQLTRLEWVLFATIGSVSFTKFYFEPIGKVTLSNLLAITFIIGMGVQVVRARGLAITRPAGILAGFFAALTCVYVIGFMSLDTNEQRSQFYKAFATWLVHGGFMVCAAAYLCQGGLVRVRRAVLVLIAGFCVNAAYGIAQLAAWSGRGIDLDALVIAPLPFSGDGSGGILKYGGGLYRINGLTRDPNHLGVMMVAPLALAATWLRGSWQRVAVTVLGLALVLTLSRSGVVAAAGGCLVLAWPWRSRILTPRVVGSAVALALVAAVAVAVLVEVRPDLARSLILGRLDPSAGSAQTHVRLYGLIPQLLPSHPLFGHGLNSFALIFERLNGGRSEFGPHSFVIQILVETGLVGATIFAWMVGWLVSGVVRGGDIRGWGIAAAICGTLVGNLFYLTTQIMYDDVLYAIAAATTAILTINYNRRIMPAGTPSTASPMSVNGTDERGSATPAPDGVQTGGSMFRYWWIIVAAVIIAAVIGAIQSSSRPIQYQANATVYIGQPVSPSGNLLPTVSAKAATAIELAKGDQAVRSASDATRVSGARIRQGLVVQAVQSPLASKLANPPTLMRVSMSDRSRKVAEIAALTIAEHLVSTTNAYTNRKKADLSEQVIAYQSAIDDLRVQRSSVLKTAQDARGTASATWSVLLGSINRDLQFAQAELAASRAQQSLSEEIETSRVVDEPHALRTTSTDRRPTIIMAGFIGLIAGSVIAMGVARMRRPMR